MMKQYFVYALKDVRATPALPFYIGKGAEANDLEQALKVDSTLKGERIAEINAAGLSVATMILADHLTESEATRLVVELIAAFGTKLTGDSLLSSVNPEVFSGEVSKDLVIPPASIEKAQIGLDLIKSSILELAVANPGGVLNSDVAKALGLQSDYLSGSRDYLSLSVLSILRKEGRLARVKSKLYKATIS